MKKFIYWLAYFLGINHIFYFLNRNKLLVLLYHGVSEGLENESIVRDYREKHISKVVFEKQVRYLRKHFNVITLQKAFDYLKTDSLPLRSVVITFDDGYLDNYTKAFPILTLFGASATIFPVTDFVNKKDFLWVDVLEYIIDTTTAASVELNINGENHTLFFKTIEDKKRSDAWLRDRLKHIPDRKRHNILDELINRTAVEKDSMKGIQLYASFNWDQMREMSEAGIEFGGHTITHPILSRVEPKELEKEVGESKNEMEVELGKAINFFAYPNGQSSDYNEQVIESVKKAGFKAALTTNFGFNTTKTDLFQLKRMTVDASKSWSFFVATVSGFRYFLQTIKK